MPKVRRFLGAITASALAVGLGAPARAAPGDLQYATIARHDPNTLLTAMRAGAEFVRSGRGRRFRIILAAGGVIGVIPGTSTIQIEYMRTIRGAGVELIACKETMDALSKANRRRMPVLPGVSIQQCQSLRDRMNVAGWQSAPGL